MAIIGRPNVGKSTFFNRVTRSRDALVDNVPGVTRDRIYRDVDWEGRQFTLVDTGGYVENDDDTFAAQIRLQIQQAVEVADVIILLLDGKGGVSPFDTDLLAVLRLVAKPVFYVVNKIDGVEKEGNLSEFYRLGLSGFYPVSAEQGYGIPDFLDALVLSLPEVAPELYADRVKVAVVGRPNVGKSSLINRLLGENRMVVSHIPGTTRDAIDTVCDHGGKKYLLIDTGGIRRKGRVSEKIEKFSVIKALKSLDRCDVALIVLDAAEGITDQDITIAGYAFERGCGCIFLLNKWDLMGKDRKTEKKHAEHLRMAAKYLSFAPILTVSALNGLRVAQSFRLIDQVYRQYSSRIGTGKLNKIFQAAVEKNEPAMYRGRRIKFFYATQIGTRPPGVVCFVNYPEGIHFSYQRYLINQFRIGARLDKTPIRLIFRKREGRPR
ncbi:MAG: ribosome biogenesis GTPase Der [Desulfobacterales bacterium]|nr:ribosome biogenesis GTPase Der [Desulfobacterales bacterium]